MNIFRSIDYKTYDIDTKINNQIKSIRKNYLVKKINDEEKKADNSALSYAIDKISTWYLIRFENVLHMINESNRDLLKVVDLDKRFLLDVFCMNDLTKSLENTLTSEQKKLFENNFEFRRNILYCSLLDIIKKGGPFSGSEFGLVFSKMFNFDYSIAMHYASYDSSFYNPRLKEFINKYLELGGCKQVYWLPNYFSDDEKERFCLEELEDVIRISDCYEKGIYGERPIQKKKTAK